MNFIKVSAQITTVIFFLFATFFGLANIQENDLLQAIQFYDNGNYTEAEKLFKKILDEKPDHLMVNYYYGACRTENGHYGTNEIIYLLNGSIGESPLKTDYYIGIQHHAKERWQEAIKYYTRFKKKVDEATQTELQLSQRIQQCTDRINPFIHYSPKTDILPVAINRKEELEDFNPVLDAFVNEDSTTALTTSDTLKSQTSLAVSEPDSVPDIIPIPNTKQPEKIKPEPINFVVNNEVTYPDTTFFKTKKGLNFYSQGKTKQIQLDSTINQIDELRSQYGSSSSYSEKKLIGELILKGETNIYKLQNETSELLIKAREEENQWWKNASEQTKKEFDNAVEEYFANKEESLQLLNDTIDYTTPLVLLGTGEDVTEDQEKTEEELVYKIQLGAYSRGLPTYVKKLFDKLSYIRKIENYTDNNGIVVYTTGNLTNYEDAVKMQEQVRQEGVEDAFVVPYFKGKRITLKEAKEIEAER